MAGDSGRSYYDNKHENTESKKNMSPQDSDSSRKNILRGVARTQSDLRHQKKNPGSESYSSTIKPGDSVSVRHAQGSEPKSESESESEPERGIVIGYETVTPPPIDRSTQKLISGQMDANRVGALSSWSVDYKFETIKPVQEIINKINEPDTIRHILLSGSYDSGPSGSYDSHEEQNRSQGGSEVPKKMSKKKRAKIQGWLNK